MRNYDILFNKTGEFIGFARAVFSPEETENIWKLLSKCIINRQRAKEKLLIANRHHSTAS